MRKVISDPTRLWNTQGMRPSQARVYNMFRLYGDITDKQLVVYLNSMEKGAGIEPMSHSGARSRRSELSKPNMDRLDEIVRSFWEGRDPPPKEPMTFLGSGEATRQKARDQLRDEGFRSALWDTGGRVGGQTIWGLAE